MFNFKCNGIINALALINISHGILIISLGVN